MATVLRSVPVTFVQKQRVQLNGRRYQGTGTVKHTCGFNGENTRPRRGWKNNQAFPQLTVKLDNGSYVHLNGDDLVAGVLVPIATAPARAAAPVAPTFRVGQNVSVNVQGLRGHGRVTQVFASLRDFQRSAFTKMHAGNGVPQYLVTLDSGDKLILTVEDVSRQGVISAA